MRHRTFSYTDRYTLSRQACRVKILKSYVAKSRRKNSGIPHISSHHHSHMSTDHISNVKHCTHISFQICQGLLHTTFMLSKNPLQTEPSWVGFHIKRIRQAAPHTRKQTKSDKVVSTALHLFLFSFTFQILLSCFTFPVHRFRIRVSDFFYNCFRL